VGAFPELEDQLCGMQYGGGFVGDARSPDRADACVWALWALLVKLPPVPGVRSLA
jgi:phage terminase large subunit-like protein